MADPSRILIVGGGYIGMYAALGLERRLGVGDARITLVAPENFMQYQPFLPEVASGTIDPRAIVVPLRQVLRRTDLVIGEVERIAHERREAHVLLPDGGRREEPYDELILGSGSQARVLPIPGLADRGVGFRTIAEAIYLRNHVLSRLDKADEMRDPAARAAALTFVFVGAGYAGIEALGELEDLARDAARTYRRVSRRDMRWVMVEAAPKILPELHEDLARYARTSLEERGIEFFTNTRLESAEAGTITLSDGQSFPAETLVWTAGVKPSPLGRVSGLPVDREGRVQVDRHLRIEGLTGAWAGGDVAAVPDPTTGGLAPPTAQHALREARVIAHNVAASLRGGEPKTFSWSNKGSVASLGHYKGVANPLGIKIKGFPAWFLHRSYHLVYMPTIGRRVRVSLDWTISLLFPRDIAQLGSFQHPRETFERSFADGEAREDPPPSG
jgi:NADH dehydrogenase